MPLLQKAVGSSAPRAVVLIRIAVGVVFASEGIQKLLYAGDRRLSTGGRTMRRWPGFVLALCSAVACSREPGGSAPSRSEPAAPRARPEGAAWLLSGTNDDRFTRVAKHLQGFDVAMVETGYRYAELYWAGQDENWDYAKYQAGKIRTAVQNGVERRPRRGPSAQMLEGALSAVEAAIAARDPALFSEQFSALTATCNACHHAEDVAFVRVRPPAARTSPTGAAPER